MFTLYKNQDTTVECPECGVIHAKTQCKTCFDCRKKWRGSKCFAHTFSILNINEKRLIKCSTKGCHEMRKA